MSIRKKIAEKISFEEGEKMVRLFLKSTGINVSNINSSNQDLINKIRKNDVIKSID